MNPKVGWKVMQVLHLLPGYSFIGKKEKERKKLGTEVLTFIPGSKPDF